jgi:SAM-dependent methyltransferase
VLRGGGRPPSLTELRQAGSWSLGQDLLVGSVLLGGLLGGIFGLAAFHASRRARSSPDWTRLVEETSRRYVPCGAFHWEFVRGKLRGDPLYQALLERLGAASHGTLLDLGCGRGIALALVDTARRSCGDPDSPTDLALIGVEQRPSTARVARVALGPSARIEIGDLEHYEPPPADVVLLLDCLHYLPAAAQERLLALVARSLRPGGRLLVREPDAALGPRFWITRAAERACALVRGDWRQRFHYRSEREWLELLSRHALAGTAVPVRRGTPFANVLIEGRASR